MAAERSREPALLDGEAPVLHGRGRGRGVACAALGLFTGFVLCALVLAISPPPGFEAVAARLSAYVRVRAPACPPRDWVLEDFGSGHWILDHTEVETWSWYMDLLRVPESARAAEYKCSDIHQYVFTGTTFVMNHTIPATNFSLKFEAGIEGSWEKNPYPALTPQGFDPRVAKVNTTQWRNAIDDGPEGTSCSALKTDMWVTLADAEDPKQFHTYLVVFWRELVSPTFMKASLKVQDASGNVLEPWASKGFSHRFFRKTVQSFGDSAKRLDCVPTGFGETKFC